MKDFYDEELDLSGLHIEDDDEYMDMDYYKHDGKNSDYNKLFIFWKFKLTCVF